MFNTIKNLFGSKPAVDYGQLLQEGAIILDVRSKGEFSGGHIQGAVNIPVAALPHQLNKLDKNKHIITCCASGMRSSSARSILLSNGFQSVHNGGCWSILQHQCNNNSQ